MITKISTVFSLLCLLLFMYGILINLTKVEENRCKMTYMFEYPQFVRIDIPHNEKFPAYGLYGYSEGKLTDRARNMDFTGAPVLFIPGNGGSYKQARSLASVALRKGIDNGWRNHLDFFTVDFNEEYSGLYGGILNNQVEYVTICVRRILKLYERRVTVPVSIVLIGHSLGGKIAQAVASTYNLSSVINTIIAISAPIDNPVLSLDHYYKNFYLAIQEQWTANRTLRIESTHQKSQKSLDQILFLTIGGGIRDTLVEESLSSSVFGDLHAMTSNWAIRRESSARSRATSGRTNCPRLSLFRCTSPFPTSFSTRLAAVYRRLDRLFKQPTRVAGAHDIENDSDEHLQMFNIDDSENETISECVGRIYPTLDESRFGAGDGRLTGNGLQLRVGKVH
uniref:GPI inositol-deacylase n=1 Tax=Culex pipiens TaxID=7175 RepID=A0A8D8FSC7_CULPI